MEQLARLLLSSRAFRDQPIFLNNCDKSICEYVDIHVDQGVMWPKPLPSHPRSMATTHNIMDILKDIKNILNDHGIAAGLCSNITFPQYPRGSPPVLKYGTVLEVPCLGAVEGSRLDALEGIQSRLSLDKLQFRVDLVDLGITKPYFHTILPDNPVVALWESECREEVLTAIRKTKWQSVNVFHCGQSLDRDQCPVTLVINAWDASESYWWDSIIPTLAIAWPYDIRLRLAKSLGAVNQDAGPGRRVSGTLNNPSVDVGSRIELGGSCGGTLGGAIDLRYPGGPISRLGLTTSQVAHDKSIFCAILRPGPSKQARWHPGQKNPLESSSSSSGSDTGSSISTSHRSNESGNAGWPKGQDPISLLIGSKQPTSKRESIMNWLEDLESHEHETVHIRHINPEFVGMMPPPKTRTIASKSEPYTWLLDWSLLKPRSPNQPLRNTISNTTPQNRIHNFQGKETTTHTPPTTSLAGLPISKRGGTTGWTDGTVNSIRAELNITQKVMPNEKTSRHYYYFQQRVSAWVGHGAPSEDPKFSMAGDAGGFILDSGTGDVVGALFGSDEETGDGYFVPFDVVVKDIERVTGAKVVNPTVRNAGRGKGLNE